MKNEIRVFFTALMFYTRIPCPKWVDHSPEYINKSIRYFPLIGWIVGIISVCGYLLATWLVNPLFGVLISCIVSVFVTGAFHEDGFADVCDGFGGGWTKEKILSIMKDSRIGAYGVVGLILLFISKLSLLVSMFELVSSIKVAAIIVCGHAISRFIASTIVFTHEYVRDSDSKAKPIATQRKWSNLILSGVFGLLPLFLVSSYFQQYELLLLIPILYLVKMWLSHYFYKWIGGYTGDCLGAAQQVVELVFYVLVMIIWKFIS